MATLAQEAGLLFMAGCQPERLAANVAEARDRGEALQDVERRNDGVSHVNIGEYLLALWGLPRPGRRALEAV